MNKFNLRIITPQKVAREAEVESISVPAVNGELTILHNHIPLFTLLTEGIVKIKMDRDEELMRIGGGYLEVTSTGTNLLVSRAYGQGEIDDKMIKEAQEKATKLLAEAKTDDERREAMMTLRRTSVDLKFLRKVRKS